MHVRPRRVQGVGQLTDGRRTVVPQKLQDGQLLVAHVWGSSVHESTTARVRVKSQTARLTSLESKTTCLGCQAISAKCKEVVTIRGRDLQICSRPFAVTWWVLSVP